MSIETDSAKCPECGSVDVSKAKFSRRAFAISFLLLGFPLPFMSKTHHCFDCGTEFKKQKGERAGASEKA